MDVGLWWVVDMLRHLGNNTDFLFSRDPVLWPGGDDW